MSNRTDLQVVVFPSPEHLHSFLKFRKTVGRYADNSLNCISSHFILALHFSTQVAKLYTKYL